MSKKQTHATAHSFYQLQLTTADMHAPLLRLHINLQRLQCSEPPSDRAWLNWVQRSAAQSEQQQRQAHAGLRC